MRISGVDESKLPGNNAIYGVGTPIDLQDKPFVRTSQVLARGITLWICCAHLVGKQRDRAVLHSLQVNDGVDTICSGEIVLEGLFLCDGMPLVL